MTDPLTLLMDEIVARLHHLEKRARFAEWAIGVEVARWYERLGYDVDHENGETQREGPRGSEGGGDSIGGG